MALTPEDVLNKHFTATQFKRGYDEQEVDDFLDEIVVELRRLSGELDDCRRGKGIPVDAPKADSAPADAEVDTSAADERVAAANARAEQAEQASDGSSEGASEGGEPAAQPTPVAAAAATGGAAGVLELAQKVYDEHVAKGEQTRDELISEAQATHDRLLSEGQARHDELIADAESKRSAVLSQLDDERDRLGETISRLRDFEQSYRGKLRGHLEDQLTTLDQTVIEDRPNPSLDDAAPEPAEQH